MNKLRLIALSTAGLLVCTAGVLVACSDDTSVDPPAADGGKTDSPAGEAGTDTGTNDAGPDAFDAGFVLETFPEDLGKAACESLANCCYGNAALGDGDGGAVDGGNFNAGRCRDFYAKFGIEGSSLGHELIANGHLELDQAKAKDCVDKVKALKCDLPVMDFQAAREACYGALRGKLTSGACAGDIECAQGFFCKSALGTDGGLGGTCEAIRPVGGNCGDFGDNQLPDPACSWRGSGDTSNYCNFADDTSGTIKDAGDWTCAAARPLGSDCYLSTWCASGICDDSNQKCTTPSMYFASSCSKFVTPP